MSRKSFPHSISLSVRAIACFLLSIAISPGLLEAQQVEGLRSIHDVLPKVSLSPALAPLVDTTALRATAEVALRRALPRGARETDLAVLQFVWTALAINDETATPNRFAVSFSCQLYRLLAYEPRLAAPKDESLYVPVWESGGVRVWGIKAARAGAIQDVEDCVVSVAAEILRARDGN